VLRSKVARTFCCTESHKDIWRIVLLPWLTILMIGRSGTCVTVTLEGRRPLVAEVQTLVSPVNGNDLCRRITSGLDPARVGMTVAVLQRRAHVQLGRCDVYAATVGGVRLSEPAVDLALALALAGAKADLALPADVVAFGEVGLAGEIRSVAGLGRRLAEAARMGFKRAIVPADSDVVPPDSAMKVVTLAKSIPAIFPPGSELTELPSKSGAAPTSWDDVDRFLDAQKHLVIETSKLLAAVNAGNQDAIGQQLATTRKACSACHEQFRE